MSKLTEKELQKEFVEYLRENNWTVWEQAVSYDKKRADVIAYRSDVDIYLGFELKIMHGIFTWTKALKQVFEYRKRKYKTNPSLWCLVIPNHKKGIDHYLWPIRFFWRFGVGVCFFPDDEPNITFINSDLRDMIFLGSPDKYHYHREHRSQNMKNDSFNIARLVKKIKEEYVI